MRYICLLSIIFLFSCGNVTPKHKFVALYEFENPEVISKNKKQGTIVSLNQRLEKFASQYEVTLNNKQQIEIKLSTDYDLESVNAIITNPGRFDFWEVIRTEELYLFFTEANLLLKNQTDSIEPILDLVQVNGFSKGLFSVAVRDTAQMKAYLDKKEVRHLLPSKFKRSKFLFGMPEEDGFLPLYIVKIPPNGIALVNETHITKAKQTYSYSDRPSIEMEMNKIGAQRWERMTGQAYRQGSQIAMTLNDIVYSAPTASSGAITGGRTELVGSFTVEEAQALAIILSSQKRIPRLKFVNATSINDEQ